MFFTKIDIFLKPSLLRRDILIHISKTRRKKIKASFVCSLVGFVYTFFTDYMAAHSALSGNNAQHVIIDLQMNPPHF